MSKYMRVEEILNDDITYVKNSNEKGVCQKCGHYTILSSNKFGVRICIRCEKSLEKNKRLLF